MAGNFVSPSQDASRRAEPSWGTVSANSTPTSCERKRQVPSWGAGSAQGAGGIAPQVAGVTGDGSRTERHDEVGGSGQRAWSEAHREVG